MCINSGVCHLIHIHILKNSKLTALYFQIIFTYLTAPRNVATFKLFDETINFPNFPEESFNSIWCCMSAMLRLNKVGNENMKFNISICLLSNSIFQSACKVKNIFSSTQDQLSRSYLFLSIHEYRYEIQNNGKSKMVT